jgi:lipoyl(octanoyl) transferase
MRKIQWIKLTNLTNYQEMMTLMDDKLARVISNLEDDTIFLLEHEDVYTAGTSAQDDELLIDASSSDIPIYQVGRGGKYTYHGPGQRVIYPILNLNFRQKDLHLYIKMLEKWIIDTLKHFDINAFTINGKIGIWVKNHLSQDEKIAAIGVRVKKWVTYHGIAVNISPDLTKFDNIIACGLKEYGISSMHKLGKIVSFNEFDKKLRYEFDKIF